MVRLRAFEGPHKTLFLFERDFLRILTDPGGEALLPLRDCLAILASLPSRSEFLDSGGEDSPQLLAEIARTDLPDDKAEGSGALSSGETLVLPEGDSFLVLGAGATEARVPLEDLKAFLQHLATTPPVAPRRAPAKAMAQTLPAPYEVPLLSPSEWLVFRAVQEASAPLTVEEIGKKWPSFRNSSLRGVVERLVRRQLLLAQGSGWVAREVDLSALVLRMLDHWMASHALSSSEQLEELVRFLDERISQAIGLH